MVDFNPSTSDPASIEISDVVVPAVDTMLSMVLPEKGTVGEAFDVSGVLTESVSGAAVVGQSVQLQKNVDGTFVPLDADVSAITADDGSYSMSVTEDAAATVEFRTFFAGA